MSTLAGLFQRGGHPYRTVPDLIALLPRGRQHAATVAMRCALRLKAKGKLDETATDKELARESERMAQEAGKDYEGRRGWSPSLIQKGLHALHVELGKLGVPLIGRKSGIGMAGRRLITIEPLAGREPPPSAPAAAPPPAPPPVDSADTTTDWPASSSSQAPPIGTGPDRTDPTDRPGLPAELLAAVDLVPGLSRERLTGWLLRAGAELAIRAAVWLRIWLCHPDPKSRPETPRWAESALERWKAELDRGTLTLEDIDATIAAKRKKWGHRDPEAQARAAAEAAAKARAEAAAQAEAKARDRRLRAAWGDLSDAQRDAIRATVAQANPGVRRLAPIVLEGLCLAELERRQAAEAPEPKPRE